jgi:hypothetical protein
LDFCVYHHCFYGLRHYFIFPYPDIWWRINHFWEWRSINRALQFTCNCRFMCERQSIRRCGCCNFQSSHADLTQLMHEFDGFSVSPHVQAMFPIASNCKEEHFCLFSVLESLWFLEAGWCIFQIAFIKDANVCRFDLRRCFCSQFCTTLCTWLTVNSSTCKQFMLLATDHGYMKCNCVCWMTNGHCSGVYLCSIKEQLFQQNLQSVMVIYCIWSCPCKNQSIYLILGTWCFTRIKQTTKFKTI